MLNKLDQIFQLSQNKTNFRTEIIAGLTTFITIAYTIQIVPSIISEGDIQLWQALFVGSIFSTVFGTLLIAFWANKPFVLAPGLGTAAYFVLITHEIANKSDLSYQEALQGGLTLVLISGIIFVLLSALGIREKIIKAIPDFIRNGLGVAIGMMLIQIGLNSNAAIQVEEAKVSLLYFLIHGSEATQEILGTQYSLLIIYILTTFIGLLVSGIMLFHKKKAEFCLALSWLPSFIGLPLTFGVISLLPACSPLIFCLPFQPGKNCCFLNFPPRYFFIWALFPR